MIFNSIYPHYITKVEKKGRIKDELHQVIDELTKGKKIEKYYEKLS